MNATAMTAARAVATELKRRWRHGEPPDAAAALAGNPDLARYKSIVVDLAYEEFLLREKGGAAPDPDSFADRFPEFGASVRNMLDAHCLLGARPELLAPAGDQWPEVGAGFEGLDVVAELGRGAFGRAYLTYDPGTDRLCVLKVAPGAAAEAKVIGRLAHPHVTDIYWARAAGGRTAVCMPFVGVSTLADVITSAFKGGEPATAGVILSAAEADALVGQADRRSTPVVRPDDRYAVGAAAVGARIADAVAYLHGVGVIHGDLKPSNVVVGPGGAPHLIDFNLAGGETVPAAVRGTPGYMAPEVLDAVAFGPPPAGIDGVKADVFALGVVLFELVTGRHPFHTGGKSSLTNLAAAARRGPPAFPASVPPPVAAAIAACLAPSPASRSTSAAAVAAALDRYVQGRRTFARRWWRRIVGALGVTGLTTATALGMNQLADPPAPQPFPPPAPAPIRPPETAAEFFAHGQAALRAGDAITAQAAFVKAHQLNGDPWALAFAAYCTALNGQCPISSEMGKRAVNGGAKSEEILNNLGYALTESAKWKESLPILDEALKRSPRMQAALYNRALARYRIALSKPAQMSDALGAEDITAALAVGPSSADLHYDAAQIYALYSRVNPRLRDEAFKQIRAAIAAGKDPARCRAEAVFRIYLGKDPTGLAAACETPRGIAPAKPPQLRLVKPLLPDPPPAHEK